MQTAEPQQVAYGHPWVALFTVFFKVGRSLLRDILDKDVVMGSVVQQHRIISTIMVAHVLGTMPPVLHASFLFSIPPPGIVWTFVRLEETSLQALDYGLLC